MRIQSDERGDGGWGGFAGLLYILGSSFRGAMMPRQWSLIPLSTLRLAIFGRHSIWIERAERGRPVSGPPFHRDRCSFAPSSLSHIHAYPSVTVKP